jgi:biofilm PGA synthesis N-glycosyltransferase PgaC
MILSTVTFTLTLLYSLFILKCHFEWKKIENRSEEKLISNDITVSVVIPFRNEAQNLPTLIRSLKDQNYPTANVVFIFVNDHSNDDSMEVAKNNCCNAGIENAIFLESPAESKKAAISFAVEHSHSEIIITTDSDTQMGKEWISSLVNIFSNNDTGMICGPVKLYGRKNFSGRMQEMEFYGLTGIGAASIHINKPMFCNGANLAFRRQDFNRVGGYENSLSQSGDDTQLMQKIHNVINKKIIFIKDKRSIVVTGTLTKSKDLLRQRKRWASKIPFTLSAYTILIAILAWFVHGLLLAQIIYSIINSEYFFLFLSIVIKVLIETILIKSVAEFYNEKVSWFLMLITQPLYCIYIFYIGMTAPFGKYNWKDRNVR